MHFQNGGSGDAPCIRLSRKNASVCLSVCVCVCVCMRSLKKRRLAQWSASADQGKVTEGVPTPVVQLSAIDPEKCRLFIGVYPLDPLSLALLLLLFIHLYY
jgi:hypothetical protein